MNFMSLRQFLQKGVTSCLVLTVITVSSMVSLAAPGKAIGELSVTGYAGPDLSVTVNGEAAKTGRTIFSGSTIVTPETLGASLNLGKTGQIQMAPGTTFSVDTNSGTLNGDLTAGSITVLNGSGNVRTLAGDIVKVNAGETVNASSKAAAQTGRGPGGLPWWAIGAIAVAAVVVVVVVATRGDDNNVSPVR
jgi:hypothetical protein